MKTRTVFFTFIILLAPIAAQAENSACKPFRIFRGAPLPTPPPHHISPPPPHWENDLVHKISQFEKNGVFNDIYWRWRNTKASAMAEKTRYRWLQCLLHYVKIDSDKDGTPDWTALVDQKPSRVLYPLDNDMDGDGVENILDPAPLDKSISQAEHGLLPKHLQASDQAVLFWQKKLREDYGILAVDHTADHSPYVLSEFYFLLQKSFTPSFVRSLNGLKTIYAFDKHGEQGDQAAYHRQAKAISVPGLAIYDKKLSGERRDKLLSTLAHELGHAFLLEKLHPGTLRNLCEQNGWKDVFHTDTTESFYSEAFFRRHPGWNSPEEAHKNNFFTAYAYSNAHEWFADAFAKSILASADLSTSSPTTSFSAWLKPHLQ